MNDVIQEAFDRTRRYDGYKSLIIVKDTVDIESIAVKYAVERNVNVMETSKYRHRYIYNNGSELCIESEKFIGYEHVVHMACADSRINEFDENARLDIQPFELRGGIGRLFQPNLLPCDCKEFG